MTNTKSFTAVFMGTPDFAARILEAILDSSLVRVAAVYTQPDRPAGRGNALKVSEVKKLALGRDLPVQQPLNFRNSEDVKLLASYKPDILIVAAYGLILPQRVLAVPKIMPINIHASLLPKYRGAAPIQRAIINGDRATGNTIMRMEAGMDTGPVLMQSFISIDDDDTSGTLHDKLAEDGGYLLLRALGMLQAGQLFEQIQDEETATNAPKLTKAEGRLDFNRPAAALHNLIRGLTPWPGASFDLSRPGLENMTVTVLPGVHCLRENSNSEMVRYFTSGLVLEPGKVQALFNNQLLVACADGWYGLTKIKPAGGKLLDAQAFYNGYVKGKNDIAFISRTQ